jgi:hypothetical protein
VRRVVREKEVEMMKQSLEVKVASLIKEREEKEKEAVTEEEKRK